MSTSFPVDIDQISLCVSNNDTCNAETGTLGNRFFCSLSDTIHGKEGETLLVGLKSFTFNNSFYNIADQMRIPVKIRYEARQLGDVDMYKWTEIFYYKPEAGYYSVPTFVDAYDQSTIIGASYLQADESTYRTSATLANGGNNYILPIQASWKLLTFPEDNNDETHTSEEMSTQHRFFESISFSETTGKITFSRPAYSVYYQVDGVTENIYSVVQTQMELLVNSESATLLKRLGFYRQNNELSTNEDGESCIILPIPITSIETAGNNETVNYAAWSYKVPYICDMGGVNWIDVMTPDCNAVNYTGDSGYNKPTSLAKTALLQRVSVVAGFGEDQVYQPQDSDITFLPIANNITQIRVELISTEQILDFQGIAWNIQLVVRRSKVNPLQSEYDASQERRTVPITQAGLALQNPLDTHIQHGMTGLQQQMHMPNTKHLIQQQGHDQHLRAHLKRARL